MIFVCIAQFPHMCHETRVSQFLQSSS
jgi:hypothetical protein